MGICYDFVVKIFNFLRGLSSKMEYSMLSSVAHDNPKQAVSKDEILNRIENVCLNLIKKISLKKPVVLKLSRELKWNEVVLNKDVKKTKRVEFYSDQSAKKFATMLKIMKIIYCLVQENRYCTKRDIFYQYPDLYDTQSGMDRVIDDVATMLEVPRWELHILATCKGLVAGSLQFQDEEGTFVDCSLSLGGITIPAHTKDMQNINHSSAQYVLVVEKDATFQSLMSNKFCEKNRNAILVTGKGYPDLGTRLLLQQLAPHLHVFILVDADPHGIEIMAVYKFGSRSQNLTIPSIQWLGVWPEDIERYSIPDSSLIPLTPADIKKAHDLKLRPYFKDDHDILRQIDKILQSGRKAEIQCLDAVSSTYLCDVYLPSRLQLMSD